MLILTRRVGETPAYRRQHHRHGPGSQGDHVRLGITAPDDVAIHRLRSTSRSATSVPCRRRSWSRPQTESTRRQR